MITLVMLMTLAQCPGGVCPVQAPQAAPAYITSQTVVYTQTVAQGTVNSPRVKKQGLLKRLFRKA